MRVQTVESKQLPKAVQWCVYRVDFTKSISTHSPQILHILAHYSILFITAHMIDYITHEVYLPHLNMVYLYEFYAPVEYFAVMGDVLELSLN